jgi:hypothetical protein
LVEALSNKEKRKIEAKFPPRGNRVNELRQELFEPGQRDQGQAVGI